MAILDFNSTIRTTAGGQTTSAIITADNIGNYGISTTSTYYIGTTQNVFNRASAAQTLTGVSIDGTANNITAYTINQNVGTGNTPSFAGLLSSAITNYAFLQVTDTNNFWITPGNNNWGLYFETSAGGLLGGTGDSNRLGFVGAGAARFYVDLNNGNGWFGASLTANTDSRAPIFYDSANTAYYLDPNNTGTSLNTAGAVVAGTYVYSTTYLQAGNNNIYPNGFANTLILNAGNSAGNSWITGISIAQGGNVGVGTSGPDTNLQVVGHIHVGNQTTFDNTGGWNKTIYLDGTVHARMRIIGSAFASGKNSQTETNIWVDNSVAPYSGLTTNAGSFTINAGFTTLTNSARSPIFYDNDDTNYYCDPNSVSRLSSLRVYSAFDTASSDVYANMRVMRNNATTDGMYIGYGNSGSGSALTRIFGGGATTGELSKYSTYTLEPGSFRSPIFYDSDNTAYYIDAASTSNLNVLVVAASARVGGAASRSTSGLTVGFTDNSTFAANTDVGDTDRMLSIVNESSTTNAMSVLGFRVNPNGGTANAMMDIKFVQTGATNTSALHYTFNHGGTFADRFSILSSGNVGFGTTSPYGKIDLGSNTGAKLFIYGNGGNVGYITGLGTDISGSSALSFFTGTGRFEWVKGSGNYPYSSYALQAILDASSNFIVTSSVRTPIFYDSDNTSYYVDAASTSSLNALTMAGTITGALDATVSFTGGVCTAASYNYILNGANDTGNKLVIFVNGSTRTADGGVNALTIRNDGGAFVLGSGSYLTSILGSSVTINGNTALTSASTLTAGNLSGTIPSGVLGNSTLYVGTTAIALNRGSASQTLTGTSIDGNAATASNATQFGGEANTNFMRGLAGGTEANINNYTDNGFRTVSYTGHTKGLLSFSVGGSIGAVQHEYYYNIPTNGWRVRNKTDSTTWSSWGNVVMTDTNQGALTGTVITTGNSSGLSPTFTNLYAAVFYDSANSAYYIDPASTSNLVGLTVANTITGSISGNAATATNATQLGGVAAANYVRNDVDGTDSTALFRLTTITKSLTINTTWQDTGIVGANLATGCYMISVYVDNYAVSGGHYQETYTGMMSWFSTTTNSTDYDEIVLHKSGHASNGAYINLRTIRQLSGSTNLKLQIISSVSTNGASNYVFKFRRLI